MLLGTRKLLPKIAGAAKCLLTSVPKYISPNTNSSSQPLKRLLSTGSVVQTRKNKPDFGSSYSTSSTMAVDLQKIGKNQVMKVPSLEEAAKELSTLTPLLAAHNVKNIGVGLEKFGLEEFVEGKFFDGDLYVDVGKKTYQDMGYKRFSTMGVLMSLFNAKARAAMAKNKTDNLPSNLKGDGLQNGGTLIIKKGVVLMDYRQDNPADHVENAEILRVLGIPMPVEGEAQFRTPVAFMTFRWLNGLFQTVGDDILVMTGDTKV